MKFTVDLELCVGCGACEATCQEVFELVDDKSQVKLDPVPEEFQEGALEAEENCPVQAISHEQQTLSTLKNTKRLTTELTESTKKKPTSDGNIYLRSEFWVFITTGGDMVWIKTNGQMFSARFEL